MLLALGFLGVGSCDDPESSAGGLAYERTVTALGGEGHATLCGDASLCSAVAVGDVLDVGTLETPPGDSVTLRDEGGFVWTLESNSRLELISDPRLVRGGVSIVGQGGTLSEASINLSGVVVHFTNKKPTKLALSIDGLHGRISVLRGEVTVERGTQTLTLERGQSLDVGTVEAPLAARYGAPPIVVGSPTDVDPLGTEGKRGLGSMTARRPGTNQMIDGMKLASHRVDAVVDRGLASTIVEEVFENTTNETLEGTFTFTLPPDALVSDLVLWVGDDPVPAEVVEKSRAKRIFKGIVDDTVRPKDPALLEWKSGQTVSLSIFPIAPKSSRRVRFRFEERLPEWNGRGQYVFPFSSERATEVAQFSMRVRLLGARDVAADELGPGLTPSLSTDELGSTVTIDSQRATPQRSLVVPYVRSVPALEHLIDAESESGILDRPGTLRVDVTTDPEDVLPSPVVGDLAVVIDRSASQSKATLARQTEIAKAVLADLDSSERFVILACDSACETFPARGMASTDALEVDRASTWLEALKPRGASDIAASIEDATARLEDSASRRLVVLGDGIATSGAIAPHAVAARAARAVSAGTDVRFIAIGTDADLLALRALAASTEGVVQRLPPGGLGAALSGGSSGALDPMIASLRAPLVKDLDISLPVGVRLAAPLPASARLGDSLVVYTEGEPEKPFDAVSIHGLLGENAFHSSRAVSAVAMTPGVVGRFVAKERIAQLETEPDRKNEIISLSKKHFVLSRETSMIVLENDAMFSAFGIERTRRPFGKDAASLAALDAPSGLSGSMDGTELGTASGFAMGAGGLGLRGIGGGASGEFRTKPPSNIRVGKTSVSGRIPPEVIQRVVRQNFGRIRLCYENERRANPSLAGGVVVSFIIQSDGSIGTAAATGNNTGSTTLGTCVARAFRGLAFPRPETGVVQVTYPIIFSPSDAPMRREMFRGGFGWLAPTFAMANDDWMKPPATLEKLRDAVQRDPEKRSASRALVRGLLAAGQFEEALRAAESLLEKDGLTSSTRELVAEARLVSNDPTVAVIALEEMTEVEPASSASHRRVARAFEASRDERRACSHWRAASELSPKDGVALLQALRCRARVVNEAAHVLDEAKRYSGVRGVAELVLDIRAQKPLAYKASEGEDEYAVSAVCTSSLASCPTVVHVDGGGRVSSEVLPMTSTRVTPFLQEVGVIRTLLIGGRPEEKVKVTARVNGATRTAEISRSERQTVFAATSR